jgi:hypothetical protein
LNRILFSILSFVALTLSLNSCITGGCTDSDASNYDPNEELEDLSCIYDAEPTVAIQLPEGFTEYTGDSFEIQIRIDDDRGLEQAYISTFMPVGTKIEGARIGESFPEEDKIVVRNWMVAIDHDNDWASLSDCNKSCTYLKYQSNRAVSNSSKFLK